MHKVAIMKSLRITISVASLRALTLAGLMLMPAAQGESARRWRLVWNDEFNGPARLKVDPNKWTSETGGSGWGNNERQYYTGSSSNASLDGHGSLVIRAVRERLKREFKCWYGPCQYSSARLITRDTFDQAYGRFEARIKMPYGQGIWPAFWMLGKDIGRVGWPGCGEIDIMENIGREPSIVHGTLHGPGYSGDKAIGASYALKGDARFSDDYHVFAIEWEPGAIRWYADGNLYQTRTPADLPAGSKWVFDHPFFIILNLAVGGNWPGEPDLTTTFPQKMLIDYVRVYQRSEQ